MTIDQLLYLIIGITLGGSACWFGTSFDQEPHSKAKALYQVFMILIFVAFYYVTNHFFHTI